MSVVRSPGVRFSLRWRLPLLLSGLIVIVLAEVLTAAYYQVERTLLAAGHERAHGAADQLAGLFAQSVQQRFNEVRAVAADAAVRQYLLSPTLHNRRPAEERLRSLALTGRQTSPYLESVSADPWGTRYVNQRNVQGGLTGVVISAGPNGIIETPFQMMALRPVAIM